MRHLRSGRGQALVEFALVVPIFAIMLFGIIDLGRYVFTANSLNNGAREAARAVSVSVLPTECAALTRTACATKVAQSRAWGVPASTVTVNVNCERYSKQTGSLVAPPPAVNACTTDDLLRVRTQANFTLVTPLIAQLLGSQVIKGESRVAVNP
jgi:Flp pilus assembly protein TadG